MNDMLWTSIKALEKENGQLKEKLEKQSKNSKEDEDLDMKILGRFRVKSQKMECAVCHLTFPSLHDMNQSTCSYHKSMAPVKAGISFFTFRKKINSQA